MREPTDARPPAGRGVGPILAIGTFLVTIGAFIWLLLNAAAPEDGGGPRGTPLGRGGVGGIPLPTVTDPPPAEPAASPEPSTPPAAQPPEAQPPDPPDSSDARAPEGTTTYTGRITDPLYEPISGVTIASGPFPHPAEIRATSTEDGTFAITLPDETPPIVRMAHANFYQQTVELEEEGELPYLLFRGGVLRGRITGPELDKQRNTIVTPVPGVRLEFAGKDGWFAEAVTDGEGAYSITAPPGPLVLTIRSDAYRDEQILDLEVDRREERVRDFELTPGVRLEVILFADVIVSEARITIHTGMGVEGAGAVDSMGKASFPGLTPGPGHAVVVAPGYASTIHPVLLAENRPLVRRPIDLAPSAPWVLSVVDASGAPRPDAEVRIRARDQDLRNPELVRTRVDDLRALDVLAPGETYLIEASAPGTARVRETLRMPESGTARLELVLRVGGSLRGRIIDPGGSPVPGASVLIAPEGADARRRGPPRLTTTSGKGAFSTERFLPGGYSVQLSHPQIGRAARSIEIRDGEDLDLGPIELGSP